MRTRHRVRQVLNAVNLTTPLGLAVGRVGGARFARGPDGLVVGSGYRLGFPVARAFTLGNAVVARTPLPGDSRLMVHEARHATQYAFLGLLLLPAYGVAALWSKARTGDWASANVFERQAGLADGGYPDRR
ncbi:MAG: hypothetical protein GEV10_05395 [Streptosporangiales bacterium]|nr:hypothetical protein [Streptosporangiales bacterium]